MGVLYSLVLFWSGIDSLFAKYPMLLSVGAEVVLSAFTVQSVHHSVLSRPAQHEICTNDALHESRVVKTRKIVSSLCIRRDVQAPSTPAIQISLIRRRLPPGLVQGCELIYV